MMFDFKHAIIIFFIALILRGALICGWQLAGHALHISDDTKGYVELAQSVARGQGFMLDGVISTRRSPIYPLFLAPYMGSKLFPLNVQVAQCIIGSGCGVLLYILAAVLFGETAGRICSALYCFDYMLIRQTLAIMPETLFLFFLLCFLILLYLSASRPKMSWVVLAGIAGGVSSLTKEAFFIFIPISAIALYGLTLGRRKFFLYSFIFLIIYSLTLLPWIVRNSLIHKKIVFLTTSSGMTLYLGNNPSVDASLYGGEWRRDIDTIYPETSLGLTDNRDVIRWDRHLMNKSLAFIRGNKRVFLKNAVLKLIRLWFPFYSDSPQPIKLLCLFQFVLVGVFSILGFIESRARWKELFPLYLIIFYVSMVASITIPVLRYRLPITLVLMIFSGVPLSNLICANNNKQSQSLGGE